jgi:Fur family ferric uptake transcriptional regulator
MQELLTQLRIHGHRVTAPRRAVIETLEQADGWLSPELILAQARVHCPRLGLVTVYRTLALLSEFGYVRRIHLDGSCSGYARAGLGHSHHLVCRSCQQVVAFPGMDDLSHLIESVQEETGFQVEDHILELLGLCPACQMREAT